MSGLQEFIDVRGYPEWITVTRVLDGGETPLFKQYFSDWYDRTAPMPQPDLREEHAGDNVAGVTSVGLERQESSHQNSS